MQAKSPNKIALDAKSNLEHYAKKIDRQLNRYFDSELKHIFGVNKKEKELTKHIFKHIKEYNLRPAKRLRSSFLYYAYKLLGGAKEKEIINASMSVELIHTGLLIHDDYMDRDSTRRGKLTTHKYYSQFHRLNRYNGSSEHYGNSMAVNIGDAALFLGLEILTKSNFDPTKKLEAVNRLTRGVVNTTFGQAYDITLEAMQSASEKEVTDLHLAKTSIYTYENPLHVGAILAGANKEDLEIISKYALPGGIAFQLQDDILGLFGDSKKTGKSAYSDLKEGKMTLLVIKAIQNSPPNKKKYLKEILGKQNLNEIEANRAKKIIIDSGSLEYSKFLSIKWAKKAQKSIAQMKKKSWNKEAINYLDGIAQYMIQREL